MSDLLLINPPFSRPWEPVISIPALAGYLRSRDIEVDGLDLNAEFFLRFLDPNRVLGGLRTGRERFEKLNGQRSLTFSEMVEYERLYGILTMAERHEPQLRLAQPGPGGARDLLDLRIQSASVPFYPRIVFQIQKRVFATSSPYHPYSSSDILAAAGEVPPYFEMLKPILKDVIGRKRPGVIGISVSYHNQIVPAFCCAGMIRRIAPDTHLTMGGAALHIFFREVREPRLFDVVDSLVTDAGEIPLERLVKAVRAGNPDLEHLPGLMYCRENRVLRNPPAPEQDMAAMPPADYLVFDLDRYLAPRREMRIPVRLSKGCYWSRCSFCRTRLSTISGHQEPGVDHMLRQIRRAVGTTGCRRLHFADESLHPETLEAVCRGLVAEGPEIEWSVQTRVHESLTRERCELYRRAGCTDLSLGVESFSDRILTLMNKGTSVALIDRIIEDIRGVLPLSIFMIVGFPSETEEEARESFRRVLDLKKKGLITDYVYSVFAVYSGSHIRERPEAYGIRRMHVPPGQDLSPDVFDLECSGMSRSVARRLFREFQAAPARPHHRRAQEVTLNGEKIVLNFDLERIVRVIHGQADRTPIHTFFEWVASGSTEVPPLPRKDVVEDRR